MVFHVGDCTVKQLAITQASENIRRLSSDAILGLCFPFLIPGSEVCVHFGVIPPKQLLLRHRGSLQFMLSFFKWIWVLLEGSSRGVQLLTYPWQKTCPYTKGRLSSSTECAVSEGTYMEWWGRGYLHSHPDPPSQCWQSMGWYVTAGSPSHPNLDLYSTKLSRIWVFFPSGHHSSLS